VGTLQGAKVIRTPVLKNLKVCLDIHRFLKYDHLG